jgi:3-hydroxyisobutyrate dehydrogenase-like beta-hydroxyacid dehydrogenase
MVACLGLGKMGAALAERLVAAGHDVCGYDISAAARDHAARSGATVADSTAGACADADAVVLCLPDAAAVEAVVLEVIDTVTPRPRCGSTARVRTPRSRGGSASGCTPPARCSSTPL